ncbi:MAG: malonyl-ACP O-methyltransferase BioC [Candidatus Omnitrophica bacterium]|nr:malonyl-ACP O-methyltransferase BioC [Candidatus Omnitrophota bacterium]
MDKTVMVKNFSRNAFEYDNYSTIRRRCANDLISHIKGHDPADILEIGCGTGIYTDVLSENHSEARIVAMDISEEMVRAAREKNSNVTLEFRVADAENAFVYKKYDLITSNASFQWFTDMDKTLNKMKNALSNNGKLCFSMYGPETFRELEEVLSLCLGERKWLTSGKFISLGEIEKILRKHFKDVVLSEKRYVAEFSSLWDFLKDIKLSGTRGDGLRKKTFIGRDRIKEMEHIYREKFGSIFATHHVFFCVAKTPYS